MRNVYVTFYPAVAIAALYGGLVAGLLATVLSALLVGYRWMEPVGSFFIQDPADWLSTAIFLISCALITMMAEVMHRAKVHAAQAEAGVKLTTERRQAEESLRESKRQTELLGAILELSSQPFGLGYPDRRLTFVNAAFEQLTGYSSNELQSIDWGTVLTPPEWREVENTKMDELLRTGQPVRYEKEYIRKNGTRVRVELLVHLATDSDGKPLYYYSFVTDVTERKEAEEALRRAKEEWERTFDSVPDMIAILDKQHRVLRVNKAMAQKLGLRTGECIGLHCYERVHGLSAPPEFCPHSKTLADGRGHVIEMYEKRLGGDFVVSTTRCLTCRDR